MQILIFYDLFILRFPRVPLPQQPNIQNTIRPMNYLQRYTLNFCLFVEDRELPVHISQIVFKLS